MSHWIMGILTAICGLAGLFMAGAARDFGILAFGLALAAYATLFCWWMIKTAFDEAEQEASQRMFLRERAIRDAGAAAPPASGDSARIRRR